MEQLVANVWWDADPVVVDPYFHGLAEITRRHTQGRPERCVSILPGPLGGRVKAVAEHVEEHPGHLLRCQLHPPKLAIELPLERDVEVLILGPGSVIGEVQRLLDQPVEINLAALAGYTAGVFQHALDDIVGALAVLDDLLQVPGQRR